MAKNVIRQEKNRKKSRALAVDTKARCSVIEDWQVIPPHY